MKLPSAKIAEIPTCGLEFNILSYGGVLTRKSIEFPGMHYLTIRLQHRGQSLFYERVFFNPADFLGYTDTERNRLFAEFLNDKCTEMARSFDAWQHSSLWC